MVSIGNKILSETMDLMVARQPHQVRLVSTRSIYRQVLPETHSDAARALRRSFSSVVVNSSDVGLAFQFETNTPLRGNVRRVETHQSEPSVKFELGNGMSHYLMYEAMMVKRGYFRPHARPRIIYLILYFRLAVNHVTARDQS